MPAYPDRGLVGRTVQALGRLIVGGALPPGHVLELEALQADFDVSRTVIREAIKVLSAKGLTDARPRRGTFVRDREHWALLDPDVLRWRFAEPVEPRLLRDLNEVRLVIEPAGAALAASRRDQAAIADLRAALDELDAATTPDGVTTADIRFHRRLLAAAGNELLAQIDVVIDVGLRARDYLVFSSSDSLKDPDVAAHRAVVDAVATADADAARQRMIDLLREAAEDVERALQTPPDPHHRGAARSTSRAEARSTADE